MDMKIRKEQKIEERRSIITVRASQNTDSALKLAKADVDKWNRIFTAVSIVGPIVISLLYLILPVDFSALVRRNLFIDIAATLTLIVALLFVFSKLDLSQCVVAKIEASKEYVQKQIETLEKRIEIMEGDQTFYISATELIAKSMKKGDMDLESLAKVLIAAIYHNLSKVTDGDNLTINLYELRNSRIKMVVSNTRLQYCERDSIDIPELFKATDGVDIKDETIQDYYCIRCIRGKVKEKVGKFLADWKTIVREFKWDGWDVGEKEDIIKNNDHDKCIELGFKYNQYFAFQIRRDDGTIGFFEIIANKNTTIASDKELNRVTNRLKETYYPLLSILWDISDVSAGKEQP